MCAVHAVGRVFPPLDQELELLEGEYTPQVYGWLARLSGWMPFAAAAKLTAALLGVAVSEPTVRRVGEAVGAAYVALQSEQTAKLERDAPPAPAGAARMVVSADGAMVPLLHGEWGEVRTLAIGVVVKRAKPRSAKRRRSTPAPAADTPQTTTPKAPPQKQRAKQLAAPAGQAAPAAEEMHTVNISYFSRFTTAEAFTHLALVETHHRGLENAGEVAAVMDGADWLQQLTDYHCPKALRILDFAHAAQHIAEVAQALWSQTSQTSQTSADILAWTQQWTESLQAKGPRPLLAELRRLRKLYPDNKPLRTNYAYLKKRQAQLQYPRFRQQGWPIGSGMVESANKLVVEARLKGAGMHWQRGHVDAMLALRNLLCNDRWEQEWPHIKTRLVTQAQRRRFPACQKRLETVQRQEQKAAIAAQHAQFVALHPEWLAAPQPSQQPDPSPPPTPRSAKPAPDHPWRHSPIGKARFKQFPKS